MQSKVHSFLEPSTSSWQYVIACPETKEAAIIDPVLNYDPGNFFITSESADRLIDCVVKNGYTVTMLLETHIHGGHLSAAYYLQQTLWSLGQPHAMICIGVNAKVVQSHYAHKFYIPNDEIYNAFDHLFEPEEVFHIGKMDGIALHLRGQRPDHGIYKIGDCVFMGDGIFTGDSLFNPDVKSMRCAYAGEDARALFRSRERILSFPPETKLYAHDHTVSNEDTTREPVPYVTVGEHLKMNKQVTDEMADEHFVNWRNERDKVTSYPALVRQAPQVNVRGGKIPGKSRNGKGFLLYVIEVPKALLAG
ncbi:hypothetical protein N7517_010555 [Penicillium concentricum]|uniref:Metallo-beta-lactamase domain-containing protein n=1 Tax=Penicillium concentricum TaxID=293559 RepID=A0A9W9UV72_9EURO|nr:uncharacterized protein N7517_010555 [Penicillium concentricum]KAJ5355946.1 hypothetical protein N7517_010555 [Penicillium concentricum]